MDFNKVSLVFLFTVLLVNSFLIYFESIEFDPMSSDVNNSIVKTYKNPVGIDANTTILDLNNYSNIDRNSFSDTTELTPTNKSVPEIFLGALAGVGGLAVAGLDVVTFGVFSKALSVIMNDITLVVKIFAYYLIIIDFIFPVGTPLALFGLIFKAFFLILQFYAIKVILFDILGVFRGR